jgi:hypothetical protein
MTGRQPPLKEYDLEVQSGNKAYAEDFDSFEQLRGEFDCKWCDSDDSVVFVPQHQLWACLNCCESADHINVNGMRLGDRRTTKGVVSVLCVQDTWHGERAIFDTPWEARNDMMSASFEDTRRRWDRELEAWTVLPEVREEFVVRLRGRGRATIDFVALRDEYDIDGDYYVGMAERRDSPLYCHHTG